MEECITVDELHHIIEGFRGNEYRNMKFMASLKGIDLDEESGTKDDLPTFEDVKRKAAAKARGMTDEQIENNEWADLGFVVKTE